MVSWNLSSSKQIQSCHPRSRAVRLTLLAHIQMHGSSVTHGSMPVPGWNGWQNFQGAQQIPNSLWNYTIYDHRATTGVGDKNHSSGYDCSAWWLKKKREEIIIPLGKGRMNLGSQHVGTEILLTLKSKAKEPVPARCAGVNVYLLLCWLSSHLVY